MKDFFSFKQNEQIKAFKDIGITTPELYFKFEDHNGASTDAWFNRGHLTPNGDFDQPTLKVRGRP